jgi:hypothetical protein
MEITSASYITKLEKNKKYTDFDATKYEKKIGQKI